MAPKILVADDNELNRLLIRRMLERLGYEPVFARNGKQAVEAFAASPFEVVIMDVQMPVMDGIEATGHLRASSGSAERPQVIGLTAHALPGDLSSFLAAGMNEVLVKPIGKDALARAMAAAFERARAAVPEEGPA